MSEKEKLDLVNRLNEGLKASYENLVRRKAALGQNIVITDETGLPRVVPASQILADLENH